MLLISNKRTVKIQEKRMAGMVDGKRQPCSGSNERFKSDATSKHFQCEAKQTQNKSMTLKLEWLIKIDKEADAVSKYPLIDIEFLNAPPRAPKEWVAVPDYVFKILYDAFVSQEDK